MRRRNRGITIALLKIAKQVEVKVKELSAVGITYLALEEDIQMKLVESILRLNGVTKHDECADLAAEPIFDYLSGTIDIEKCLQVLKQRVEEIRHERTKVR